MLRHPAVLGFLLGAGLLLPGCTQDVMLVDQWDASARDASSPPKDTPSSSDSGCRTASPPMTFTQRAADIVIVLDRSAAMQSSFSGTTRIAAAESALSNVISTYQNRVKFGFEQFPADSSDKAYADCQHNSCCVGSVTEPVLNNLKNINTALDCSDSYYSTCPTPSYDSPSNLALAKVRDYFKSHQAESDEDRYVLLVTASEPSCSGENDACDSATNATNDLGALGVRVVVLTVGYQPGAGSCLKRLTDIGSSLATPHNLSTLYPTSSQNSLISSLNQFVAIVAEASCTQDSLYPVPDGMPLTVSIGDKRIYEVGSTKDDGWSFANSARTTITLSGSACDQWVISSSSKLYVNYECSTCPGPYACPWL